MEVKVCGMRDPENIRRLISEVKPDWMGLIFYPKSPRYVSDEFAAQISKAEVNKVGVFVNADQDTILEKVKLFGLKAIQLHGRESIEMVKNLTMKTNCEIWKVISVEDKIDWDKLKGYLPFVNRFLFDTASPEHGGSGKRFNWAVLETYPLDKGFLLSGGLDENCEAEILALAAKIPQMHGVDLNSKFEETPGLKNIEKLKNFKEKLLLSGRR